MGKIGEHYYPDIDPEEAVKYAKIIYDFPSHSLSVQMLAEKLGLKTRGGWTGMIIASLKKYGLVDGRGTLRATDLTEKIVNPKNTQELQSAKADLFNKIELWKRIRYDYGEKVLSSDFWAYLAEKHSVDRVEAKKKGEKVAKLYTKSVAFCFPPNASITSVEAGRREMTVQEASSDLKALMNIHSGIGELRTDEYGILKIKDVISIDIAITLLQSLKEKIMSKTQDNEEQ